MLYSGQVYHSVLFVSGVIKALKIINWQTMEQRTHSPGESPQTSTKLILLNLDEQIRNEELFKAK